MDKEKRNRAYKITIEACRQIDYLSLLMNKSKPEVIESAVELLFNAYAILPVDIRNKSLGICIEAPSEDALLNLTNHIQKFIKESVLEIGKEYEQSKEGTL